jgi:Flp pilus assembly protein TadD
MAGSMPVCPARAVRLLASTALAASLAIAVAGCNRTSDDITGSLSARAEASAPAAPVSDAEWRQSAAVWGERYRRDPNDIQAAIAYARALRATDQRAQAVAVLEQASLRHPNSQIVLGAYGRALADAGQYVQALDALSRAHTPDNPDWRILNAQGAVLDQLGRHAEARKHYEAALKIVPGDTSVLSNLGLSYALTKDLNLAEKTLREAASRRDANPRVRQNLALVVGLQGRFDEAERIASADLPPAEAEANVRTLREMLAQQTASRKQGKPLRIPHPDAGA